jgi:hypothetical protein
VLDEIQLVAGEQHRDPGVRSLDEYLAHRVHTHRVQPGERLVEHEQLRVVYERGR